MKKGKRFLAAAVAGALVLSMTSMTAFAGGRGQRRDCSNASCVHVCVNADCAYVDEDGDGVCDHYENDDCPNNEKNGQGHGKGKGHQAGAGMGSGRGRQGCRGGRGC